MKGFRVLCLGSGFAGQTRPRGGEGVLAALNFERRAFVKPNYRVLTLDPRPQFLLIVT